jgi:nitroreductase/NAD-dependent dihydropyrimidine dehydrogenase PreA subunit
MQKNTIEIDRNKCTVCGNCVKVCPGKTLELIDNNIEQTKSMSCISCGHCAAICPEDAIKSVEGNPKSFTAKIYDDGLNDVEKLLAGKRSVREFRKKDIDKDMLENFIHYAEKAPSSSNKRKREYIVITDKDKILELEKAMLKKFNSLKIIINPLTSNIIKLFNKKLANNILMLKAGIDQMNIDFANADYQIFRNAPCIVLIIGPKKAPQAKDDCVIADQYMMLYAQSHGIASCIIGYAQFAHKTLEQVLKIKKGHSIYAVSIFGYPKFTYKKEINYINLPKTNWI